MELRTRILPKLLNSELEQYLQHNDIIIVPVGTVEMHGGFPLDSETVVSEAIARSLLRLGFKRQVYLSFHGPAHMTICPMVRDFFDETGVPILYTDMMIQMGRQKPDWLRDIAASFHAMTVGAYQIMGRLEDVPLTTEYDHRDPQTCAAFNDLFGLAYQSAAVGYCFADPKDHMPTPAIPDIATRQAMAERGVALIEELVQGMDMPHVVAELRDLEAYNRRVMETRPWMPAAWNTRLNAEQGE